jgi:uncharacterized LabA/DUF88 family protein
MLYTSEKVAVLIDGHALAALGYGLGMKIDYRKFKARFARSSKLATIKYYALVDADKNENPYIKLLDWLDYNGYRIHRKEARRFEDDDGGRHIKGSVIAELSVDLVLMAQKVDHIVMVGAHGDYSYPILQAQRVGARVTLLSSLKADGMRPADELRRIADEFIDLDDMRDEIGIP